MDRFSPMGPLVTDTIVTLVTDLGKGQERMDNWLNGMWQKTEERNTSLTIQFKDFQENRIQQLQRGSFLQNRGQN